MSLEEEFHAFAEDAREFQGEMRAWTKNMGDHISSVSRKADDIRKDLNAHDHNLDAHGIGGWSKGHSAVITFLCLLCSVAAVGLSLIKLR